MSSASRRRWGVTPLTQCFVRHLSLTPQLHLYSPMSSSYAAIRSVSHFTNTASMSQRRCRLGMIPKVGLRRTAFFSGTVLSNASCTQGGATVAASPQRQLPLALEQDETADGEDGDLDNSNERDEWVMALEGLFLEALKTYYQGTPMFSDGELETLREELDHLGSAQVRLGPMEKIWVQATSARDFDRRVREEFEMSEEDLKMLKTKLLKSGTVQRPTAMISSQGMSAKRQRILPEGKIFLRDATKIEAGERVDERLKWLLFSDATEERLKILLLYLPAVTMSFVAASVLTILFALLDGEMKITVTSAGRFRLGILSWAVVMLAFWFSNEVTPVMLDYLDLGQPTLMRGACPICGANVSCLFTGAARARDERKCTMCGSMVGFNRKWSKVYLVSPPGARNFQEPD